MYNILIYFILFIVSLVYPQYCFCLTDSEYHELMNSCPSFKKAEHKLNEAWKQFYNSIDLENRKAVIKYQRQWLSTGRDKLANDLINNGYDKCSAYTFSVEIHIDSLKLSKNHDTNIKNTDKLIIDIKKRADNGSAFDQYGMGLLYRTGTSVKKDYVRAKYYFELAANQNFSLAQNALGDMYFWGDEIPQDYQKAYKYCKLAANSGVIDSIFKVGYMHYTGKGVEKDNYKAKLYIEDAANQEHKIACYFLGIMYENGEGVRQNIYKAKEMYGKACDEGYEDGCKRYKELNTKGY